MLEVEEGAEAVHSVIEGLESRVFGKEGFEAQRVGGRKVVLSFAQGSQRAAMVLDWRGDLAASSRKCWVTMRTTWKRSATILARGK